MIANKLQSMIGESMKAHDELRTSTLRLLSSAFNYERIEKQHDLTEDEELLVIRREAKKRRESIEAFEKAGRVEMAKKEKDELEILAEFLPPEMDESELEKIVDSAISEVGAVSMADMGKVIGAVKAKVGSSVEGGKIAQLVSSKLTKNG